MMKRCSRDTGLSEFEETADPGCTRRKEDSRRDILKKTMKWIFYSIVLSTSGRFMLMIEKSRGSQEYVHGKHSNQEAINY